MISQAIPKSDDKNLVVRSGGSPLYQYDPLLGFWGVPNLERNVIFTGYNDKHVLVVHDEDGNRNMPISDRKKEKSIVCLGGSHTWGSGVDQGDIYTVQLANLTNRDVVNMGHCSMGLDQVCLAILNRSEKYSPSVVIIEQYPWAIHRILNNYVNRYVKPVFYLDANGDLKVRKVHSMTKYNLIRKIIGGFYSYQKELREFQTGLSIKDGYDSKTDPIFLLWKCEQYNYMYELAEKIIIVIRDYCREKNIRLIFTLGALQQHFGTPVLSDLVDYDLPTHRLINLFEKNKIAYIDMKSPMLEANKNGETVIYPDGHINARGHRLFAEIVQKELARRGWLN